MMETTRQTVHLISAIIGFVSLYALWSSMLWGIVLRNGWAPARTRYASMYAIHQIITLLGLCLGVVHALVQLAIPGGHLRLLQEWIPFTGPGDHRLGVGLGVAALELMLALALSVAVQRQLGYWRWRSLHLLSYPAFLALAAHVLFAGATDQPPWLKDSIIGGTVIVISLRLASAPGLARLPGALAGRMTPRPRERSIALNVDPLRCERYGFCAHEAPRLFQLHTDGRLLYAASVPADRIEEAAQAARVCPKRAIVLGRLPSTMLPSPDASRAPDTSAAQAFRSGRLTKGP